MLHAHTVVQRLNKTLKFDEIISSVIQLVSDIIPTNRVEIYIFDTENNRLNRVTASDYEGEQVSYALGEGLIGLAAQHRIIRFREQIEKIQYGKKKLTTDYSELWMAVPIMFKERLLGMIGQIT